MPPALNGAAFRICCYFKLLIPCVSIRPLRGDRPAAMPRD